MIPQQLLISASTGLEHNTFQRLRVQRQRHLLHVAFLVRCKKHRLIPAFIHVSCHQLQHSPRFQKTLHRLHLITLRCIIKDTRSKLARIESQLYELHLRLAKSSSYHEWTTIDVSTSTLTANLAKRHADIHQKKFHRLKQASNPSKVNFDPNISPFNLLKNPKVVNISSTTLTSSQTKLLELGLNFSQTKHCDNIEIIKNTERAFKFSKISPNQKDYLRQKIASVLIDNNKLTKSSNLNNSDKQALIELKNNESLIITKADKGGAIVTMDTTQYQQGISSILNDGSYLILKRNPLLSILNNVKSTVKSSTFINDVQKRSLIPSHYHPGYLYILPKIHKPVLTFRPIISTIGTPTYLLSKFIADKLSYLFKLNPYNLQNSSQFVESLKGVPANNTLMVSFDVVSLFTSIPVKPSLSALKKRLLEINTPSSEIDNILIIVEVCTRSTVFSVNQQLYQQVKGLPMGGCLSPVLCDVYLYYIECEIVLKFPNVLILWKRYVDDCFSLWNVDLNFINDIVLPFANSLDPHIKFTLETENNNHLPYLDVSITRVFDNFETTVYRKSFSVQMPPHKQSANILSQKISAFYTFVDRALKLCSTKKALYIELQFLRQIATDRGFNHSIINTALRKLSRKSRNCTTLAPEIRPKLPSVTIPYTVNSSRLSTLLRSEFRIISVPPPKLCQFLRVPKDTIPDSRKWGIYYIPCQCKLGYIGQTRRFLNVRISEHRNCVKRAELNKSNIAAHSWNENHQFNFSNAKIIRTTKSHFDLDYLETCYIKKFTSELVNDHHYPPLSQIWNDVLQATSIRSLRHQSCKEKV